MVIKTHLFVPVILGDKRGKIAVSMVVSVIEVRGCAEEEIANKRS
jgi:hypothetical protein